LISSELTNNVKSSETSFNNIFDHDNEYNEDQNMANDDRGFDSYDEYSSDDNESDDYETESEDDIEEKVYVDEDQLDFAQLLRPALTAKKLNSDYIFALLSDRPVTWDAIVYSKLHTSWKTYFEKSSKDTDWIEPIMVFYRPNIYKVIRNNNVIIKFNHDYFFDENMFFAYLKLSIKLISQSEYEEILNPTEQTEIIAPIKKTDDDVTFSKAIDLTYQYLGPSAVPDTLIMRNTEYNDILSQITSSITNRSSRNIFVCGYSGMGKSMVVGRILKDLSKYFENGVSYRPVYLLNDNIEDKFQIVRLLGTSFSSSLEFFFEIARQLGMCSDEDRESLAIKLKVVNRFENISKSSNSKKPPYTLLVIDEFDRINVNVARELMLFSNSSDNSSSLILVGIGNIVSFTENRGISNVKKIVFAPYNYSHLSDILKQRMCGLINNKCADFIARKIEKNLNCDVRKLLDIGHQVLTNAIRFKDLKTKGIVWKEDIVNEETIDDFILLKDTVFILGENGIGSQRVSTVINVQSAKLRSFLVALVVSRLCTTSGTTLREMHRAYNTYAVEKHLIIMTKDQIKIEMLDPLLCYHLIENHSNTIRFGNKRRLEPDKVYIFISFLIKLINLLNLIILFFGCIYRFVIQ
jgi:Cdc6-like AAA superfamily ATPase